MGVWEAHGTPARSDAGCLWTRRRKTQYDVYMFTQRWTLLELEIDREGKPVPSGGGVGGYSYVPRSTCTAASEPEARAVFMKSHPTLFDPTYKGNIPRAWIAQAGSVRP